MKFIFLIFKIVSIFFLSQVALAQEDIKDIRPPVNFPPSFWFLIMAGIIILLVALMFLGWFLFKKIKKKKEASTEPPKPPHEIAYEALEALRRKNLPNLGKIKEYYSELSDIVRHYLENRFNIRAPEMTTEEFLLVLRESDNLVGAHKNLLKEFLNHCDLVKFAKYGPTNREIDESFNSAKRLVDETKIIEAQLDEVAAI